MENLEKYHGSTLSEAQLDEALKHLEVPNIIDEYKKMRDDFIYLPKTDKPNEFSLKPDFDPGAAFIYDKETDNRSAWGNAIGDLAKLNKDVKMPLAMVDCDLMVSVKTGEFASLCPDRFFQSGIMENNAAVLSGALSTCGIQTFWADFGVFGTAEVYNNQRLNDINHTNLKVVVTHVGIDVGEDGRTHQCIDYIGLMRNLYGFRVIVPADPNQTDRAIRWLVNQPGNYLVAMGRSKIPLIYKEGKNLYYGADYCFEYGKIDTLREGKDACVVVCGTPVGRAIKAIEKLQQEGFFVHLAYVSCPLGMRENDLSQILKHDLIFSVEDNNVNSGLGNILADKMVEHSCHSRLVKIGIQNYPISGTSEDLYRISKMDTNSLYERFKQEILAKELVRANGKKDKN
jgi:transketolase